MVRESALRDGGNGRRDGPEPIDRILEVLSHPIRREILGYLVETSEQPLSLDDVVDHLAAERGVAGSTDAERRIALQLIHVQLPKLAEQGAIEYDPMNRSLRYRGDDDLETWLDRVREWVSD